MKCLILGSKIHPPTGNASPGLITPLFLDMVLLFLSCILSERWTPVPTLGREFLIVVLSGKTTSLGAKPCPDLFCSGCRARDQRPWQEIGRKIGTQSNEAICGTKVVKPVFGPNYCELVSTKRSVCRSLAYLREQGNGHRKNTDFPTLPTGLEVFPARTCQSQGRALRWERTQRGVHPGRGPPAPGQEASSNTILTLNDRWQRERIL